MRRHRKAKGLGTLLFFIVLALSPACFEPEEGCLDIAATNFDASADDPCSDCCTYPNLKLSISHLMGDTTLRYGDPYTLDNSRFFRIARIRFYISELELLQNGQYFGVSDTLVLDINDGAVTTATTVSDNFALISRNQFDYTFGNVNFSGQFDSLRFKVGINSLVNRADPASVPDNHPLTVATDSMYFTADSGYVFNQILLQRDSFVDTDTTTLSIGLAENLIAVTLPLGIEYTPGFDVTVRMDINYLAWFTGINFEVDPDEVLISKIVTNTAQAFSLVK